MKLIELPAWSELVAELSVEQASAIEREELANVLAGPTSGIWRVKTGAKVGVIVGGFPWHATWAIDRNLLHGYLHRDERRVDIRGRVRFGDQIARSGGLPLPVEVSYDDFTEDILENRMLKTATLLLLRFPRVPT